LNVNSHAFACFYYGSTLNNQQLHNPQFPGCGQFINLVFRFEEAGDETRIICGNVAKKYTDLS
jgi:hypothetical protein